MTDMKWTTVKRKKKDPGSEQQKVPLRGDLPDGDPAAGGGITEIDQKNYGYVPRQTPKSSANPEPITAEQQQLVQRLYVDLEAVAKQVMATKRSDKEAHEHALEKIRSLLNRIITIYPSRYETPLGKALENAITKIYTVIT